MSTPTNCIKRGELLFADPAHIVRRKGWNPRFDFGDLSEIENTMKDPNVGFYKHKPLLVRRLVDGNFELIDGERRFTVVEKLIKSGIKFEDGIPIVLVGKTVDDAEALVETLTANNGKPLLPLEEAAAYKTLGEMGLKPREIAKRVGMSEGHIKWTLELLTADDSVKDAVKSKKISGTLAKTIATKAKGNAAKQKELVAQATSGKAGKAAAKKEAQAMTKNPARKRAVSKATILSAAELTALASKNLDDMMSALQACGLEDIDDVRKFAQENDERSLSFLYGVSIGLAASMGKKVKVTL